jgi:hypothetical protein
MKAGRLQLVEAVPMESSDPGGANEGEIGNDFQLAVAQMASIRWRPAYPAIHLFLLHEPNPIENRAQTGLKASQNRAAKNRLPRTS